MDVTMERGRWVALWRATENWPGDNDLRVQYRQQRILGKIEAAIQGGDPREMVTVPMSMMEREMLARWLASPPVPWMARFQRVTWDIRAALGYPLPVADEEDDAD